MRNVRLAWLVGGWLLLGGLLPLSAQDPVLDQRTVEPAPAASPSKTDDVDIESLREPGSTAKLFPDQPAPTPEPGLTGPRRGRQGRQQGGVLGKKANSGRRRDLLVDRADADPLVVRVAYRRAKTVAMTRDPGLAKLLKQAAAAGTDPEKRTFLKQYYVRLYDLVEKIDRSLEMKKHVETLRLVSTNRYDPKRREVGGDEDITLGRGGGRRGGGRNR